MARLKFFPSRAYSVRLSSSEQHVWERLKASTHYRESLASVFTNKMFIGQVRTGSFRIITSEVGVGAFCSFDGDFLIAERSGTIRARVLLPFRVMLACLFLMFLVGPVLTFIDSGWRDGSTTLLVATVTIVVVRFLLLERFFRARAKDGLQKLSVILELAEVKELPD